MGCSRRGKWVLGTKRIRADLSPHVGSVHSSSVPGDKRDTQRVPTYQMEKLRMGRK